MQDCTTRFIGHDLMELISGCRYMYLHTLVDDFAMSVALAD